MPGLEPGIQAAPSIIIRRTSALDARLKPVHDETESAARISGRRLRVSRGLAPRCRSLPRDFPVSWVFNALRRGKFSPPLDFRCAARSDAGRRSARPSWPSPDSIRGSSRPSTRFNSWATRRLPAARRRGRPKQSPDPVRGRSWRNARLFAHQKL